MAKFSDKLRHAWNAFSNGAETPYAGPYSQAYYGGGGNGSRPGQYGLRIPNGKTIISSIYTRMAIDASSIDIRHVRLDDEKRYLEDIDSGLNNCLTLEANIDQAARQFRMDMYMTLFEEGVVALVPVDTSISPLSNGGYDIKTMRVGRITDWFPRHVRVNLYNEATGNREDITLPKSMVAIIVNPLYSVMNEPNSTLQRLLAKLTMLDAIDEASSSGKLDLIIQLPYVIRSDAMREKAEQRKKDIEFQLKGSQYGIAYADGTEKITQLNRPAENNLMGQIEFLTKMLYGQLGLTEEVMNGTADEKTMLNYWNRSIEPLLTAAVESMRRSFITKTARSQKQWILFFRDPFKLVPIETLAEIFDVLARNEVAAANEMRQVIGWKPSSDPKADQLINSNMPQGDTGVAIPGQDPAEVEGDPETKAAFDEIDKLIDTAFEGL